MNTEKIIVRTIVDLAEACAEREVEVPKVGKYDFPLGLIIGEKQVLGIVTANDFDRPGAIAKAVALVEWHSKFIENGMPHYEIETLIKSRGRLSTYLEAVGTLEAELEEAKMRAEYRRKTVRDALAIAKNKTGISMGLSEKQARAETLYLDNEFIEATKQYKKCRAQRESINQILNAISSEIKHIEEERKRAAFAESAA